MAVAVLVPAAVATLMGLVFIGQGTIKGTELRTMMRVEQVTLALVLFYFVMIPVRGVLQDVKMGTGFLKIP